MRVRYKKRFLKEAPQQTLNLALLCLQVLIAHRELEIGKQDTGVSVHQHQIGENPGWRLDTSLELQVAPVLAPVVP